MGDNRLTKQPDSAVAELVEPSLSPFTAPEHRGIAEIFAGLVLGASFPGKNPWWVAVVSNLLGMVGLTAALVWAFFVDHAIYALAPGIVIVGWAFLLLARGARQREGRLVVHFNRHMESEFAKLGTAKLAKEWCTGNPLERLIHPYVLNCNLSGKLVRLDLSLVNLHQSPKSVRMDEGWIDFKKNDPPLGEKDLCRVMLTRWSEIVPGKTTHFTVPQHDPVSSLSDEELESVRDANHSGCLRALVTLKFSVEIDTGDVSRVFNYATLVTGL